MLLTYQLAKRVLGDYHQQEQSIIDAHVSLLTDTSYQPMYTKDENKYYYKLLVHDMKIKKLL